ncbi:DMT family transporter [Alicyclobacillus sp.]|uniref:DMT family transporter n=1 Tax=Alicyclobacillus sp. TaxID=61169 RepID=UPI0025C4B6E7|nr:DMT family transporter [Alicyclobacillus sp.]MCL6517247.1 DMT family transporter [Alicyclobacillus sp.]
MAQDPAAAKDRGLEATPPRPPVPVAVSLFAGVIAVSFSAIFIKWCSAPPAVIGAWRLWITLLLLFPAAWRQRDVLWSLRVSDWGRLMGSGAFLGLHFLAWIGSLHATSVASSMIITALQPVFVMLGARLWFGERTSATGWASVALALAGTAVIPWGDRTLAQGALYGDLLSLLGTLAISGYLLIGQRVRSRLPSTAYNTVVFAVAAAVLTAAAVLSGQSLWRHPARDWALFALLALVPTLFGHALFNWLLRYVDASLISVTVLGEPVGAIALAAWLLGEPVRAPQAIGGLCVLVGVGLYLRTRRRTPSGPPRAVAGEAPAVDGQAE